ncbi:glycosyltransferase [Serratia rubidaea]|uniref:Glycosyltransferase n=1 Tax=Serratia rubidaea TaxID=61652 RepID=A0ABS0M7V8_SERRU|nr:glycosyltransferase [Serratia rubidaea]MBH1928463.1 glycosyltransferase [Serratia rubidaea]MDC6119858.1 glycosyltransferase [Serratia rubidaea]
MKKILIVTPDIEGPIRNGGIGTAFTSLAINMAKSGFDIEVLYTCGDYSESADRDMAHWISVYEEHSVKLTVLPMLADINIDAPYFRRKSYTVYHWLKDSNRTHYDVVISCEWQADLYYTLLAKGQGLFFTDTKFIINTHSSTLWADEGNYQLPYDQNHMELYFMEQKVVEMADEVISPSQYLLDWMRDKKWELPADSHVILNCEPFSINSANDSVIPKPPKKMADGVELVFFGRLETRKGLDIFLRALHNLKEDELAKLSAVTFMGKGVISEGFNSIEHIRTKTDSLNVKVNIITGYDRTQADAYITRGNVLVVIPSLVENSPYTVYESLIGGVNFIASSVGGIKELIPAEQHSKIIFEPTPSSLYQKITFRLDNLQVKTQLVQDVEAIEATWVDKFNEAFEPRRVTNDENQEPLVSVCLVHHDRSHLLQQAIASLKAQTYSNFEVILVDDGSVKDESRQYLDLLHKDFADKGWKIIKSSNNYLGAARNLAARSASGEYLVFMDDDNVAKPHELETFVRAAINSGSDLLTTPSDLIYGDEFPSPFRKMKDCWLPLGADLNVASFANCFGDANAMIRKSVFDSVGGFTEDYGIGHEDWELFCRVALAGHKIQLIPEALFWYRVAKTGMLISGNKGKNNFRSYRPFMSPDNRIQYTMGLIHSYIDKINRLERDLAFYRSNPASEIGVLNEKIDYLISQQRDGWAHDRFNVLFAAVNKKGIFYRAARKLVNTVRRK